MSKLYDIFSQDKSLDGKSVGFLVKALEANNVEGFDYLEFKQSLAQLNEKNIPQDVAMTSAFTTASTMGLTKERLLQSCTFYQKVLQKEKEKFDEAHQNQVERHVNAKTEKVKQLQEKIDELKVKIGELEEKVRSYKDVIEKARADIAGSQSKIEQRKQKFEEAFQAMSKVIANDIESIEENL